MPGLLGQPRGGLLSPRQIRQPGAPGGQPLPMPYMGMPMGGQGGGDPRDAPGTSVSIWRELMRGLSQQGLGMLGTQSNTFSPANLKLLAPEYQKGRK